MKTTINKLAAVAIFAFILLAGNVRAEGNDVTASGLENMTESTLQLENWMTDETIWDVASFGTIAVEEEAELEMEDWMLNDITWNIKFPKVNDTEEALHVEGWMTNETIWKI